MNQSATGAAWTGEVAFAPMRALFVGVGGETSRHQTVVHKIVVGAESLEAGGCLGDQGTPMIIPAGVLHQIGATGRKIVVAYLDARHYGLNDAARLAETWGRLKPGLARVDCLQEDVDRISPRPLEKRIGVAIDALEQCSTIREAAGVIGLSEGRFTHLISDVLDAPPRRWRNWLRLRRAIDHIVDGRNITTAACEAGFADSAHLSRACHAHLGIRPSVLKNDQNTFIRSTEPCKAVFG